MLYPNADDLLPDVKPKVPKIAYISRPLDAVHPQAFPVSAGRPHLVSTPPLIIVPHLCFVC